MKATFRGLLGALTRAIKNQACMWSEPDLVGWLEKRGGKCISWKKRFFILQGSFLFYFADDFKVQEKTPLGVIPLDSSKVEIKKDDSADSSRRYTFYICLGKQYIGYSKRDTYVVAAPSHQAFDEWVQRLKIAADTRESLLCKLMKARWRGGDLRRLLENSVGNQETLELAANKPEGHALAAETIKVHEGIRKLELEVATLEAQANQEEGALMRAIVVWDIFHHYLSDKAQGRGPSKTQDRIKMETEGIQQLYRMQQAKASYLEGQKIEHLLKEAREKLRLKVEHDLQVVQERQAKIRSKAPRYSFNLDPKIFDEDGESYQSHFKLRTEESRPFALKAKIPLRVAGINVRSEDLPPSRDAKCTPANAKLTDPNMLIDMITNRAVFPVEDASANHESGQKTAELAKILSKAPRYLFHPDHLSNDDDAGSVQPHLNLHAQASHQSLRRAEVLETVKQLESIRRTSLKVAGTNDKSEGSYPLRDNTKSISTNRKVIDTNMRLNMVRKQPEISVENATGQYALYQKAADQAKISSKEPRYSIHLATKIPGDDAKSVQPRFKLHAQESQQSALRVEVLERADKLENTRTTDLEITGIDDSAGDSCPSRDTESISANRKVTNPSMLIDMVKKHPQQEISVKNATGQHTLYQETANQAKENQQSVLRAEVLERAEQLEIAGINDRAGNLHHSNMQVDVNKKKPVFSVKDATGYHTFYHKTADQTKVSSKAPIYVINQATKIAGDDPEFLPSFKLHGKESQQSALKADVLEKTEQLENVTALETAGINDKVGAPSGDTESISTLRAEVQPENVRSLSPDAERTSANRNISFKGPRYSFKLDPMVSDATSQSLQLYANFCTQESQPSALRAEILETDDQPENFGKNALKIAGTNDRTEDSRPSGNAEAKRKIAEPNILIGMIRKQADSSVEDASKHHASEEQAIAAWIQEHQYRIAGMENEPRPFQSMQIQMSTGSTPQMPTALQLGRPQPQAQYLPIRGSGFQGLSVHDARPIHQPVETVLVTQGLLPRGFQQHVGSMPQPPGAPLIPAMRTGKPLAMGLNFPARSPQSMPQFGTITGQQQGSDLPLGRMPRFSELRMRMASMSCPQSTMIPEKSAGSVASQAQQMPTQQCAMQPMPGRMLEVEMQPMQPRNPPAMMQLMKARIPESGMQPSHERILRASMRPMQARMQQTVVQPMQGRMAIPFGAIASKQGRMPILQLGARMHGRMTSVQQFPRLPQEILLQQNHIRSSSEPGLMYSSAMATVWHPPSWPH